MFRQPATFGPPLMAGRPRMFGGRGPAAATGVESEWCVSLDRSSSQYVDAGTAAGDALGALSTFSVSLWFYATSATTNQGLIYIGNLAYSHGALGIAVQSSKIAVLINSASYLKFDSFTAANQWNHLAVSYDGSNVRMYLNGVLQSTTAFTGSLSCSGKKLIVGNYYSVFYGFNGRIDDVRVYSRALSGTEVNALVDNMSPPTSGLVFYLPMEEGTGTTTVDSVGGVTATLVGGATWSSDVPPALAP